MRESLVGPIYCKLHENWGGDAVVRGQEGQGKKGTGWYKGRKAEEKEGTVQCNARRPRNGEHKSM